MTDIELPPGRDDAAEPPYDLPPGEEVFQAEADKGLKVHVSDVVQVTPVGARTTGFRKFILNVTEAQRILDDDPRRASATIIPLVDDIRLGGDAGSAISTGGTRLPVGVPLVLDSSDEVWAGSVASVVNEVSVFYELWAR